MKKTYLLYLLLFALVACQSSSNESEKSANQEKTAPTSSTIEVKQLSIKCTAPNDSTEPSSQLEERVKKLAKLKDNYQIKELDEVPTNTSGFYSLFQSINELDLTRKQLEITDPDELLNMVDKTTYCFVRGMIDHGDRMFARASIEEYLFKSEACAEQFEKHLETIQETSYTHAFFGKSLYSVFRIKDKIYYVILGGHYTEDYPDQIQEAMKN